MISLAKIPVAILHLFQFPADVFCAQFIALNKENQNVRAQFRQSNSRSRRLQGLSCRLRPNGKPAMKRLNNRNGHDFNCLAFGKNAPGCLVEFAKRIHIRTRNSIKPNSIGFLLPVDHDLSERNRRKYRAGVIVCDIRFKA